MNPALFRLGTLGEARQTLEAELEQRKSLGVQVVLTEPDYVGVRVKARVMRASQHRSESVAEEVRSRLLNKLYYFINPITGGFEQEGWQRDRPITPTEIIALLQAMPEIQYVAEVELLSIRHYPGQGWAISSNVPEQIIHPGKRGFLCSWADEDLGSEHVIEFVDPN
jgi:hypothetical protein